MNTISSLLAVRSVFPHFRENLNATLDSHKEVISLLKFISKIQPGEKICVKYRYVQPDTLLTRLSRTFITQETRQMTGSFVTSVINKGFELIYVYLASKKTTDLELSINTIRDIVSAKLGVKSLMTTYEDDVMFICNMETLLEEINARITQIITEHIDVFGGIDIGPISTQSSPAIIPATSPKQIPDTETTKI